MTTFYAADATRPGPRPDARKGPGPWWPWVWMTVASTLLAASGAVRAWQGRRIEAARSQVITPAFPLSALPTAFGPWKLLEGREAPLDPEVARISGAVDSSVRSYSDEDTGVVVTVLVLLAHAGRAVQHKPEVCYPAIGYTPDDDPLDVTIGTGSTPARFRSLVFKKEGGTATLRQEVFYAFRHGGVWAPDVSGNWRDHLHDPAFYKVQVQRAVTKSERRTANNPTEQFLAAFLPALETRIRGARSHSK